MPSSNNTEETYDKYAATTWGQPREFDFVTPSGQIVLMKKLQIEDLMQHQGLLNQADLLTGIVESEVVPANREAKRAAARKASAAGMSDADKSVLKKLQEDPESSKKFLSVCDSIVVSAVLKPELHLSPEDSDDRRAGLIYIDTVGFNDKMAIFNKAMEDTGKLSSFRAGSENSDGAVEDGESV